jgi:hypothetical protein
MEQAASKAWPKGTTVVVPCTRRHDSLWRDIQAEEQDRIGSSLQAMHAELVQQTLSPRLTLFVREIKAHWEVPILHG